jgi:hypothetical protein
MCIEICSVDARSEVLMAATLKIAIFWDVTCCPNLQSSLPKIMAADSTETLQLLHKIIKRIISFQLT